MTDKECGALSKKASKVKTGPGIERHDREFKVNDHWSPYLSRWFLARHPEFPEFFETRERRAA